MQKTPDEIKKGLECCTSRDCGGSKCPYFNEKSCNAAKSADALALIQQLEAQNAEKDARIQQLESGLLVQAGVIATMRERIQQLEAERDVAVETIYEMAKCITEDVCEWCDGVECERLCMQHNILRPGFKWRGVQKED